MRNLQKVSNTTVFRNQSAAFRNSLVLGLAAYSQSAVLKRIFLEVVSKIICKCVRKYKVYFLLKPQVVPKKVLTAISEKQRGLSI
jgi:hypothetical protein